MELIYCTVWDLISFSGLVSTWRTNTEIKETELKKLWKNWTVHNIISHPVSEVLYLLSLPFAGREKAENISGWIHDVTLPDQVRGTGRG